MPVRQTATASATRTPSTCTASISNTVFIYPASYFIYSESANYDLHQKPKSVSPSAYKHAVKNIGSATVAKRVFDGFAISQ
jgi:hypothetical protein